MEITLVQFLTWLTVGGCVIAASWIMDKVSWFQKLKANVKLWVQVGISSALGIGALLVLNYVPLETLELIQPYWSVLATVFAMVFLNQTFHKVRTAINKVRRLTK